MKKVTYLTVALVGLALLLAPLAAEAGRGPRASLASATTCALDLGTGTAELVVTTTLTNKSSGGVIPAVVGGTIAGTYKAVGVRGNMNVEFDSTNISSLVALPADVDPELVLTAAFDICTIYPLARELNGKTSVSYQISGGSGDTRTVTNRCTDDLDTPDNEGAIKVADYFDLIEAACTP